MTVLGLDFAAGAFHANPWSAPSRRELEWPPAPWRLSCAIAAAWNRIGSPDPSAIASVLEKLAEPPTYLLPRAMTGRSRHVAGSGAAQGGATLDSFIALDVESKASGFALWPNAELTTRERSILKQCCDQIDRLDTLRSPCALSLLEYAPSIDSNRDVLAALDLAAVEPLLPGVKAAHAPQVLRRAVAPNIKGAELLSALLQGQENGACEIPDCGDRASIEVAYQLPVDFLMVREQHESSDRSKPAFDACILRLALARGRRGSDPAITAALPFAELLRAAVIEHYSRNEGEPATLRIAGKSSAGGAREGHDHPYFLPFALNEISPIEGIDVWFPRGCTHAEYRAVTGVSTLYERNLYNDDFPLAFEGLVKPPRARVWRTATPIALERFPKVRGIGEQRRTVDAPEHQVSAMIARAVDETARVVTSAVGPAARFRAVRLRKPMPPYALVGATIEFARPVDGPIVLGRLAHFGLGRFEPCDEGDH